MPNIRDGDLRAAVAIIGAHHERKVHLRDAAATMQTGCRYAVTSVPSLLASDKKMPGRIESGGQDRAHFMARPPAPGRRDFDSIARGRSRCLTGSPYARAALRPVALFAP